MKSKRCSIYRILGGYHVHRMPDGESRTHLFFELAAVQLRDLGFPEHKITEVKRGLRVTGDIVTVDLTI